MTQILETVKKEKKRLAYLAGCILLIGVAGILLAANFSIAASGISPNIDQTYVFYTKSLSSTTLPLTEEAEAGTALLAFTREGQTYTCVSRENLGEGDEEGLLTDLPLPSGSTYMVGITSLSEAQVSVGTVITNETSSQDLVIDDQTIRLQAIEIREDMEGPVIDSAAFTSTKLLSSDNIEITFSVADDEAGVAESTITAELLSGVNTYAMSVTAVSGSAGQYAAVLPMSTFTQNMTNYASLPSLKLRVTAKDQVGNEKSSTQDMPTVEYTGIREVSAVTQTGSSYVKKGEEISVYFTTDNSVNAYEITASIANQSVTKTQVSTGNGKSNWKVTCTIPANVLTDGDPILFSIVINDNGKSVSVDQTSAKEITYQTSIAITGLTYRSDNADITLVHNGETVTITFTSGQYLTISNPVVAGKTAASSRTNSNGIYTYTITYLIRPNDISYNGEVGFSLGISKGGETQTITQEDCTSAARVRYELPFKVSGFSIISTNAANGQAATQADSVIVSFVTSADVHVNDSSIAGVGQASAAFTSVVQADGSLLWTSAQVICTNGSLQDAEKIPFALNLSDNSGNTARITQDNADAAVYFFKPIQVAITSVSNSGTVSYTKNGDVITVQFTTAHSVTLTSLTCGNLGMENIAYALTQTDTAGKAWKLTYTVKAGMYDNSTPAVCSIGLTDAAGNTATLDCSATGITYLAPIEITAITVTSSNGEPTAAKVGDTISITFSTNNPTKTGDLFIGGNTYDYDSSHAATNTWTISYLITEEMYEDGDIVQFSLAIMDEAESLAAVTNETASSYATPSSVTFYGDLSVTGVAATSSNAGDESVVVSGDTVTVTFQTQHKAEVSSLYVAGESVSFTASSADNAGLDWTVTYAVTTDMYADNREVSFTIQVRDVAYNSIRITQAQLTNPFVPIHYYAPLTQAGVIYGISFVTSNATQGVGDVYTRDGDTLTVRFHTTHPILTPTGNMAGYSASFSDISGDGMYWQATCTLTDAAGGKDSLADNTDLAYSVEVWDAGGNLPVTLDETRTAPIRYFAPIADGLSVISFVSDNQQTSGRYANNASTVTLSFTSTHRLIIDEGMMADASISFVETSTSKGYIYEVVVPLSRMTIEDNTDISFTYRLTDCAGNEPVTRTEADAQMIRYQAPISVQELSMVSNNAAGSAFSVNGNQVTLRFCTTHPVVLSETRIAGQEVIFSSNGGDGMNWVATYTVKDGDTADLAVLSLSVLLSDVSGNAPMTLSEQSNGIVPIVYYAPIAITNLQITTNNANDTAKFAKNGDIVFVSFTTNHEILIRGASIAGQSVTQSQAAGQAGANSKTYTLSYVVQNGAILDLSSVTFAFTCSDVAGNTPVSKSDANAAGINRITYYAPITSVTKISSDGVNAGYAKNGDTITLGVVTNHNVTVQSAAILGKTATIRGMDTTNPTMIYLLSQNESVLPEGIVAYSYRITDAAGNEYEIAQKDASAASQVVYDRTAPEMTVTPRFNGFTNQTVIFDASFKDVNLDKNGISILLNGVEQISSANRLAISGTTYDQAITIETDEMYVLTASITDLAGNRATPDFSSTITIDKTAPTISSATLSFSEPQVYKTGFVLGTHLDIVDENVSEVICMMTDADGSRNWNMDDPILTDGKKTIYLLVTDFAGNTSKEIVFDMYIDATAPVPVVSDTISGRMLSEEKQASPFLSEMTLDVSLQDISLGNESADHFTTITLLDGDGQVVQDILGTMQANADGSYTIDLPSFGSYTLQIEAEDSVGNSTGVLEYSFTFKDKSVFVKYYENKPVFYSTTTLFAVLVIGGISLIAIRKHAKRI